MLYAILCYDSEDVVGAWTKAQDDAVMASLGQVQDRLRAQGRLGPVARLVPTTAATTVRKGKDAMVIDGPFAETKEQLLGFYVVECADLEQPSKPRASSPPPAVRPVRSSFAPWATFNRTAWAHDRPRLDRRGPDRRAPPGVGGSAALVSRSRHRGGGVPGSLPPSSPQLA